MFNKKIVDYLKFAREFAKLCPGFETDIHGLVEVEDEAGRCAITPIVWPMATHPKPRPLATAKNLVQVGDDGPYGRNV